MVKKILIVFGVILALLVAAAFIVPLVVDVDKYRPQLVSVVNDRIQGKLELGKLSLSFWGQVRVDTSGLKLLDASGAQIVSVQDASFDMPFASVLSGAPQLTLKMKRPTLRVIKDKSGQLNVMSLMKPEPPRAEAPAKPQDREVVVPALLAQSRLGVELKDAVLLYQDQTTGLDTSIKDLNLRLKDLSLSRPMEISAWADLDTQMGGKGKEPLTLKGPFRFDGKSQLNIAGGKLHGGTFNAKADFDQVEIVMPGLFEKKKGIAANAELSMSANEKEIKIDQLLAKLHNAQVMGTGVVTQLSNLNLDLKSNEVELKPWADLIPMLKSYDLGGTVRFEGGADGPTEKLNYHGKILLNAITAKAPKLKTPPRIEGVISILTDRVENLALTMKAPGNELAIRGKVLSFAKPRAEFVVSSLGMDLDQLIEFPPPKAKTQAAAPAAPGADKTPPGEKGPSVASDYDAMIEPFRSNKKLAGSSATVDVDIKALKAYGVKMTDLSGRLFFRDLAAGLDKFSVKLWGGLIQGSALAQLAPKVPSYRFSTKVSSLDLSQAVASQFALFKNTLIGKASADMAGEGASFNPEPAIGNLKARGSMKVEQAKFATIDVGRMVSEALNQAVDRIGDKVPQVKGKRLGMPPGRESRYRLISSSFTIQGGKFSAPDFHAQAEPNQGIDLKGSTEVGLKDYSLKSRWEVIDTYNLTGAKSLSVEQDGIRVDHVLAQGNQPVHFPVTVGCTVFSPCFSYTEVPEYLGKVALSNVGNALKGRAEAELRKKAESLIKGVSPDVQKKLEDFKKKLFH